MARMEELSLALSKRMVGDVPETILSLSSGTEDDGEEVDVAVAAVECEEEDEEEVDEEERSGRHSSQQQQQQSMKAWPSARHRHSRITGVAAARANIRNWPISCSRASIAIETSNPA